MRERDREREGGIDKSKEEEECTLATYEFPSLLCIRVTNDVIHNVITS